MRARYDVKAPKRAVNLSLNSDLVAKARGVTGNLSEVVESLLVEFLAKEQAQQETRAEALRSTIETWNAFGEKHGSFADEHSTL